MRRLVVLILLAGHPALAWEAMAVGDLAGKVVRFADAVQRFDANGTTVYTTDQDSRGNWREQAGLYCSAWPPSDRWDCYGLEREGEKVRFVAKDGGVTEGVIE